MKTFLLFALLFTSGALFAQRPVGAGSTKIKKYNKKKIAKRNYFFIYDDKGGTGTASQLKLVKPDRSFWGSVKDDGSIIIIKQDKNDTPKVIWKDDTTITIPHPIENQLLTANQYYFPDAIFSSLSDEFKGDFKWTNRIKYRDFKFVLQAITIPLKFRNAVDTFSYQAETGINVAFGAGLKWAYNWYKADKSFFGQKTNQLSFTPGLLFGLGAVDVKAKSNAPASFKDRKEPILSYGGFFMVGFNNINIGISYGWDRALKDGGKSGGWAFHGKPWTGVILALDIIK